MADVRAASEQLALPVVLRLFYETELTENMLAHSLYARLARRRPLPEAGPAFELAEDLPSPPDLRAYDDGLFGAVLALGRAAAELQDELCRRAIAGNADVLTCGDGAAPARLNALMVDRAAALLERSRAARVGGMYLAVVPPAAVRDLRAEPDWLDASRGEQRLPGELGRLHAVRFFEDARAETAEVCTSCFFGGDSLLIPDPEGGAAELLIRGGNPAQAVCRLRSGASVPCPRQMLRVVSRI